MLQSITVKFLAPTNHLDARWKAKTTGGSTLTLAQNDGIGPDDNATLAAYALADRMGWDGEWHGGATVDGYVFVCVPGRSPPSFKVNRK